MALHSARCASSAWPTWSSTWCACLIYAYNLPGKAAALHVVTEKFPATYGTAALSAFALTQMSAVPARVGPRQNVVTTLGGVEESMMGRERVPMPGQPSGLTPSYLRACCADVAHPAGPEGRAPVRAPHGGHGCAQGVPPGLCGRAECWCAHLTLQKHKRCRALLDALSRSPLCWHVRQVVGLSF